MGKVLDKDGLTVPKVTTDLVEIGGGNLSINDSGNLVINDSELIIPDLSDLVSKEDLKNYVLKSEERAHNVGDQWISMDGTLPVGGVPFNGQILNITDFQDLYNWAQSNSRIKTEEEWQTLNINNNSNVPYYSSYSDTQFRMPIFRGYLKANNSGGGYTKEGLPNITGSFYTWGTNGWQSTILPVTTGAFTYENSGSGGGAGGSGNGVTSMDASLSNPIYGNSEHVTPETNNIIIGVYAFNTVINSSILDAESQITNNIHFSIAKQFFDVGYPYSDSTGALMAFRSVNYSNNPGAFEIFARNATTQKVLSGTPEGALTWNSQELVRLVTSYKNGYNWYRKYSDGWIEQGGVISASSYNDSGTFTFNQPFKDSNYTITSGQARGSAAGQGTLSFYSLDAASFSYKVSAAQSYYNDKYHWFACGY